MTSLVRSPSSSSAAPTSYKAIGPRRKLPIRISLCSGKMPTPISPSTSKPKQNTRSCNSDSSRHSCCCELHSRQYSDPKVKLRVPHSPIVRTTSQSQNLIDTLNRHIIQSEIKEEYSSQIFHRPVCWRFRRSTTIAGL